MIELKEHRRRLGSAALLFFYLAGCVTKDAPFPNFGLVGNGEGLAIKALAKRLGLSVKTVRQQLLRLMAHGYIAFEETKAGLISIAVSYKVWNTQDSPLPNLTDLPSQGIIQ